MQPHLTSYHSGLLTKTLSFFPDPRGLWRLDKFVQPCKMETQWCRMMYGIILSSFLMNRLYPACLGIDIIFILNSNLFSNQLCVTTTLVVYANEQY